jgi:nucleoid-associated protein YgaU
MLPSLYEIGYIVRYTEGDFSLQRTPLPFVGGVGDIYHTIKHGETLLQIAQKYYNDQFLWYIIADANPLAIPDVFDIIPNTTIFIPSKDLIQLMYG